MLHSTNSLYPAHRGSADGVRLFLRRYYRFVRNQCFRFNDERRHHADLRSVRARNAVVDTTRRSVRASRRQSVDYGFNFNAVSYKTFNFSRIACTTHQITEDFEATTTLSADLVK
jgi:hypothetical protein